MKDFPTENADVNGAGEEAVGGTAAAQLRRNIELLPLERLTAYKGNARTHSGSRSARLSKAFGVLDSTARC